MNGCIAIADIHGCLDELDELMELLTHDGLLSDDTTLVFLGDYLDRGPSSAETIEYLIRLRDERNCIFLRGNHDDKFLDLLNDATRIEPVNGEFETVISYSDGTLGRADIAQFLGYAEGGVSLEEAVTRTGVDCGKETHFELPGPHLQFLESLRLWWEQDRVIFCHGGIKARFASAEQALSPAYKYELLTARGEPDDFLRIPGKVQVVGHRRRQEVLITKRICMTDTGCMGGGSLTALAIPRDWSSVSDFTVRQVPARRNWHNEAWNEIEPLVPDEYIPITRGWGRRVGR